MVQPHTATVSSVIVYQCQQSGFTPSLPSSVCGDDGTWSPDPSQVMCVMIPTSASPAGTVEDYQQYWSRKFIEYLLYYIAGA